MNQVIEKLNFFYHYKIEKLSTSKTEITLKVGNLFLYCSPSSLVDTVAIMEIRIVSIS